MQQGILSFIPKFEKDKKIMDELNEIITETSTQTNSLGLDDDEQKEQRQVILKFIQYLALFRHLTKYSLITRFLQEVEELHSYVLDKISEDDEFEIDPEDYKEFYLFNEWVRQKFIDEEIEEHIIEDIHNEDTQPKNH